MAMSGPHYLENISKHDQIHFPLKDSHHDPMLLIKNSSYQEFQGFQEDYLEFYNPIAEWLEKSCQASSQIRSFNLFSCLLTWVIQVNIYS